MNMHRSVSAAVISALMFCSVAARAGDGTSDMRREFEKQLGRDFKGWYFVTLPFTGDEIGTVRLDEHKALPNKTILVNLHTWFRSEASEQEKTAVMDRIIEQSEGPVLDFSSDQTRKSGFSLGASFLFRVLNLNFKADDAKSLVVKIKTGKIKVRRIVWEEFAAKVNAKEPVLSADLYNALKEQPGVMMCLGDVTVDGYEATVEVNRQSDIELAASLDALAQRTSKLKGKNPNTPGAGAKTDTMDIQLVYDDKNGQVGLNVTDSSPAGKKSVGITTTGAKPGSGAKKDKPNGNTADARSQPDPKQAPKRDATTDTSGTSTTDPTTQGSSTDNGADSSNSGDKSAGATQNSGGQTSIPGVPSGKAGLTDDNRSKGIWIVKIPKEVVIAYLYATPPTELRDATHHSLNSQDKNSPVKLNRNATPKPLHLSPDFEQAVRETSSATQ